MILWEKTDFNGCSSPGKHPRIQRLMAMNGAVEAIRQQVIKILHKKYNDF